MTRFAPISPTALAHRLVDEFDRRQPGTHPLRVGVDAPASVDLGPVLEVLRAELPARGHPVALVAAADFYRDASLRFEYGHTDVESFYTGWLDIAALQREVLTPVAETGRYLPSLRDRTTNRATRVEPLPLEPSGVLLVHGELMLGVGLAFDVIVHVAVSRQARRRQFPEDRSWQLPAFDRYDLEVDPAALADIVVRWDDPQRPAVMVR